MWHTEPMPKQLNFTLSEEDLTVIKTAEKTDKRPQVRQRAMGLRLLHEGHAPQEVARIMAVSQPTVYDWHHRWQESGLAGLSNRPKSGRPRKAAANYVERLREVIEQDPHELGYAFTIWTSDRLRLHMEAVTGTRLGTSQFRALLKENGFVYRRPKHVLTDLQDPQAREAATSWLEEVKKAPKQTRSSSSLWTKAP